MKKTSHSSRESSLVILIVAVSVLSATTNDQIPSTRTLNTDLNRCFSIVSTKIIIFLSRIHFLIICRINKKNICSMLKLNLNSIVDHYFQHTVFYSKYHLISINVQQTTCRQINYIKLVTKQIDD